MALITQVAKRDCAYISNKAICVRTDIHLYYRMITMPGGIPPYMAERQFIHPVDRNVYPSFNLTSSTKCKRPHAFRRKRICTVIELRIFFVRSIEKCSPSVRINTIFFRKQPPSPIDKGPFDVGAIIPQVVQIAV